MFQLLFQHMNMPLSLIKNLPTFGLSFLTKNATYLFGRSLFYLLKLRFFYHVRLHCSCYFLEFLFLQLYIVKQYKTYISMFVRGV